MPNAKVLSEKQAIVAALTEKVQNAAAGVLVDYKGITVAEDTALRAKCRENDIEYTVIKNTLLRFAFNNCGLNELDDQLNGTTSLAICASDPVASIPALPVLQAQVLGTMLAPISALACVIKQIAEKQGAPAEAAAEEAAAE